jgi:hypothetical protein
VGQVGNLRPIVNRPPGAQKTRLLPLCSVGQAIVFCGLPAALAASPFPSRDQRERLPQTLNNVFTRVNSRYSITLTPPIPHKEDPEFSMRSAILDHPALQQCMGNLFQALLDAPPEHHAMIHLVVEARRTNGQISILFTFGSPELPSEYSTLVPDTISNAAFKVINTLLQEDERVPGFEVVLRRTGATQWETDFHRLDEPGPQWSVLPRYPLRVYGFGYSLAPPVDTVYRWARNRNPPAIIAAARKDPSTQFKRAQITFTDSGIRTHLADGAAKAEEVIQVAEGPGANQWVIETPAFHALWPEGLDLRYPLASKTRFDLLGPDDAIIFVQGPLPNHRNLLDEMTADGQTEIGRGRTPSGHEWIELGYAFEEDQWRQRHYRREVSRSTAFVVTAQCLQSHAEQMFRLSSELTDSLSAIAA